MLPNEVQVWDELRATRWSPPGAAKLDGRRRATYVSALEQSEQLFRAATSVGSATRPLLIFYGLSQAGRAITAAAPEAHWELRSHGIKSDDLEGPLPDIKIKTTKDGSFVRLSNVLNSSLWRCPHVSLNDLWDMIPENERWPLRDEGRLRRTPLLIEARDPWPPHPHPLASTYIGRFPSWVVDAEKGADALHEYLRGFPEAVRSYHSYVRVSAEPGANPKFERYRDGWGGAMLDMHWEVAEGCAGTQEERTALLLSMTRRYGRASYFFPSVEPGQGDLHPLMAWWAVLHALSMLARYQPAEWAEYIDVDKSSYATPIERLLDTAIDLVPRLIAGAIDEVVP